MLLDGRPVRFAHPGDALAAGHRHGPPGAGLLRKPDGGGEPLPGLPARARGLRLVRGDTSAGPGPCSPTSPPRSTCSALVGEPDGEPAADGPDRGRGGPGRAGHRVRRAHEQPHPPRDGAPLRPHPAPPGPRRDRALRLPPHGGDLRPLRHHHRAARRPPRGDAPGEGDDRGQPRGEHDRPAPRRVLPGPPRIARRRGTPARRGRSRAPAASRTSPSRCARARWWAWPASWARDAPSWPRPSSASTPAPPGQVIARRLAAAPRRPAARPRARPRLRARRPQEAGPRSRPVRASRTPPCPS